MTPDRDPDDERPGTDPPLPPEDRLWRHPSEIGAGGSPPAAWVPPPSGAGPQAVGRRTVAAGALAGACLAGALVAVGAMWVTRPTRVVERGIPITTAKATPTASLTFTAVPSERIATDLGPSLPVVRAQHDDGAWTGGTGVWLDDKGTVLTASPLVAEAGLVLVTGTDGISRRAKVRGTDQVTGVTVLTVSRTSGTPISARSTKVRAGEPVVIVGAPGAAAGDRSTAATTATALVRVASMRSTIGALVVHDALQLDRAVPADAVGGVLVDAGGR